MSASNYLIYSGCVNDAFNYTSCDAPDPVPVVPISPFPIIGSNFRIKSDGTFQLLDVATNQFRTTWLDSTGGLHQEFGPAEY